MTRSLPLLGLCACSLGQGEVPVPDLDLTVTSPTYAEFAGDSPTVRVTGHVNDPAATVWVEGRQANVGTDGSFDVELPVPGPYRVVDIEAANPKAHLRERVPVFSGHDPMETWPGAIGARVTPLGLEALGDSLEPTLADLGLMDTILDVLPSIDTAGFTFVPVSTDPGDLDVRLLPAQSGMLMEIEITGVMLEADFDIPLLGADTLFLGLDQILIGIEVQPEVDASGMLWLSFGSTTLELADPTLETGTIDPVILENLLGGAIAGLGPLAAGALDGLIQGIGSIPLGGPFDFTLDLLGTPMTLGIDDLYGDLDGLALVLGMDFGEAGNGGGRAPGPAQAHWASHAVLALHEGLFQVLLGSDLLDIFSQDLNLGGMFGNVLALPITALSGGEGAPVDATGWCLAINPGEARVARMKPDPTELAVIYLPDFRMDVGYQLNNSTTCYDWLEASLAVEVGLGIESDGNIDLGIDIGDGAVLSYATTAPYDEKEVVAGLGSLVDLAMGLLGGGLGLNLGDLFGGGTGTGLGGLPIGALEILDVRQINDPEGQPVEGLMALSVRIF